ncbi:MULTISPECIES: hypothetical protein [Flavobacterium]|uniref:Addiction module component n=1 Tax=Flavobacterium salmonis TaxID=2654844 RepID=A0A6V6YQ03_9FLAO|nr:MULTISPECIES: hypothetical protein [Flavobacterium]OOV19755.1 hypothetical protein BXU10_09000 [Flavobacterium sp. LM4]CAD0001571.1 hypothetical protein FLAT13_00661 [Flavobacterium salmonis]
MDIQLEKLELIKLLVDTEDPTILKSIRKIFKKEQKDWWDDLTDEQKEDLELSMQEFERGEVVGYESILKRHGLG